MRFTLLSASAPSVRIFGGESSAVRRQLTYTRGDLDTMYQWRPSIRFQSPAFLIQRPLPSCAEHAARICPAIPASIWSKEAPKAG